MDALSIATYAADQIVADEDRSANLELIIDFAIADAGWMVQLVSLRKETSVSRTAQILAEARQANTEAINAFNARLSSPEWAPKHSGERTTARLTSEQEVAKQILLKGSEAWNMNAVKREHQLPRRALSMASSKGRCTPDMLDSLMRFFRNPSDMAHTLLLSFLPEQVSTKQANDLLSDPFVIDVIEGRGTQVPTPEQAVKALKQARRNGRASRLGAAGRVMIYKPGTAPTVDPKRRGRPSGPKYVAHLEFGTYGPVQGCDDVSQIPGGNDAAHGTGHDQGQGWAKGWAQGKALTPAQVQRRNAALDEYHTLVAKQSEESE